MIELLFLYIVVAYYNWHLLLVCGILNLITIAIKLHWEMN